MIDIDKAVKHPVNDEKADHQKGCKLDQAFKCHGQDQAIMMFGCVDIANAKQDGEHRHQDGDIKRRILGKMAFGMADNLLAEIADQYIKRHRNRFELKRNIGQHANHRDQRNKGSQTLAFAIARTQEIGNRGNVLLMTDARDLGHDAKTENHHQNRTDIDRQERPSPGGSRPHRAKEGPACAIDRHRQGINRRL